ncbi:MAG: hypothetical protein ABFD08_08180 [Syntrophomonas sp.]
MDLVMCIAFMVIFKVMVGRLKSQTTNWRKSKGKRKRPVGVWEMGASPRFWAAWVNAKTKV